MRAWIESTAGVVELTANGRGAELGPVFLGEETEGLGFASARASFASGASPGARVTGVTVGEQGGALHLVVRHPASAERRRLLRLIADVVRYRDRAPLPRFVVELDDGSEFEREFVSEGSSSAVATASGGHSVPVLLAVTFPHPYWRARQPEQIVQEPSSEWALLPLFAYQQVVNGAAAEVRLVENRGSIEVPVSWQIMGPAGVGSRVLINGEGFELVKALASGQSLLVQVSAAGISVTMAGVNAFAYLGPNSEFPWLPDGRSSVELRLVTPLVGASRIVGTYLPEVEVVH